MPIDIITIITALLKEKISQLSLQILTELILKNRSKLLLMLFLLSIPVRMIELLPIPQLWLVNTNQLMIRMLLPELNTSITMLKTMLHINNGFLKTEQTTGLKLNLRHMEIQMPTEVFSIQVFLMPQLLLLNKKKMRLNQMLLLKRIKTMPELLLLPKRMESLLQE